MAGAKWQDELFRSVGNVVGIVNGCIMILLVVFEIYEQNEGWWDFHRPAAIATYLAGLYVSIGGTIFLACALLRVGDLVTMDPNEEPPEPPPPSSLLPKQVTKLTAKMVNPLMNKIQNDATLGMILADPSSSDVTRPLLSRQSSAPPSSSWSQAAGTSAASEDGDDDDNAAVAAEEGGASSSAAASAAPASAAADLNDDDAPDKYEQHRQRIYSHAVRLDPASSFQFFAAMVAVLGTLLSSSAGALSAFNAFTGVLALLGTLVLASVYRLIQQIRAETALFHGPEAPRFVRKQILPKVLVVFLVQVYGIGSFVSRTMSVDASQALIGAPLFSCAVGVAFVNFHLLFSLFTGAYLLGAGLVRIQEMSKEEKEAAEEAKKNREAEDQEMQSAKRRRERQLKTTITVLYIIGCMFAMLGLGMIPTDYWVAIGARIGGSIFIMSWAFIMLFVRQLRKNSDAGEVAHILWHSGNKHHFFISHAQANAQDQVHNIHSELTRRGCTVWWDQKAAEITDLEMQKGVRESVVFMLFLTDGALTRPFVQMEVRTALSINKPILMMMEKDPRHGAPKEFYDFVRQAPDDLKWLFERHEVMDYRRRGFEADAMFEEVIRRMKRLSGGSTSDSAPTRSASAPPG